VVIPLFMLLVLGLADLALAELSDTAGSNAAREGARVGILNYDNAHTVGSTNYDKITDAVRQKLAGNVKGTPTVVVHCLAPDGTARRGSGTCSTVGTDIVDAGAGGDFIEVSVTWNRKGGITGFVGSGVKTDRAVMRIVGTPPTGAAPPTAGCSFVATAASPTPVVRTAGGDLPAITFTATVNDRTACGGVTLSFPAESGYPAVQTMTETTPDGATFSFTMPAAEGTWTSGTKTVVGSSKGGAVTENIGFEVQDPAVCAISPPASVNSTQVAGELASAVTFTVSVSSNAVCGAPRLSLPAEAAYATDQTMALQSGTTYTFTMPAAQGAGWTSKTYTVPVSANAGATAAIGLVVSPPALTCSLNWSSANPTGIVLEQNGNSGKTNGKVLTAVTFRVARSAPCGQATLTVEGPGSLSAGVAMTCSSTECAYTLPAGAGGWDLTPASRTVTVTDTTSQTSLSGTAQVSLQP
jgi:hypothetical protein